MVTLNKHFDLNYNFQNSKTMKFSPVLRLSLDEWHEVQSWLSSRELRVIQAVCRAFFHDCRRGAWLPFNHLHQSLEAPRVKPLASSGEIPTISGALKASAVDHCKHLWQKKVSLHLGCVRYIHDQKDQSMISSIQEFCSLPDNRLAYQDLNFDLLILDLETGKILHRLEITGEGGSRLLICLFPLPQERLASVGIDDVIRIWDLQTGKVLHAFSCWNTLTNLFVLPGTKDRLASIDRSGTIYIWDLQIGKLIAWSFHPHLQHPRFAPQGENDFYMNLLPNGKIAVVSWRGIIEIFDPETRMRSTFPERGDTSWHSFPTNSPPRSYPRHWFLKNGKIVLGTGNGDLWIVDLITKRISACRWHPTPVIFLASFPGDKKVISASRDGTTMVWDLLSGRRPRRFDLEVLDIPNVFGRFDSRDFPDAANAPVLPILTLDEETFVCGLRNGEIKILNAETGEVCQTLNGHRGAVCALCRFPGGGDLASASRDGTIRIWDLTTGKCRQVLHCACDEPLHIFYDKNGRLFASACADLDDTTLIRSWNPIPYQTCIQKAQAVIREKTCSFLSHQSYNNFLPKQIQETVLGIFYSIFTGRDEMNPQSLTPHQFDSARKLWNSEIAFQKPGQQDDMRIQALESYSSRIPEAVCFSKASKREI